MLPSDVVFTYDGAYFLVRSTLLCLILVQACFSSIHVIFCRPGNGRRQAVEWWPNNQKVVSSSPLVAGIFLFPLLKCRSVFIFLLQRVTQLIFLVKIMPTLAAWCQTSLISIKVSELPKHRKKKGFSSVVR